MSLEITPPQDLPKESDSEAFDRLAKLPLADYDRCRLKEAEKLGVRIGTLDAEVQKRRPKSNATLQGGSLGSSPADVWPDPVNGAELLDDILAQYARFMVLPPHVPPLLAIWTLHTYVFDQFSFTPYIHVRSPEKECGKSTLAELMNHLCANATTPGGMSAASMYRRIDRLRPTLLLDEWDTMPEENRIAALNVLNTGFKWNGVYTICVGDDHEDRDFHTFCPKAIFGLADVKLPDTTRSRCFPVILQKKLPHQKTEKLTRKFDGSIIRQKCARWAKDNLESLANREPEMPSGLSARQEDISEPLLAIGDLCGGNWPEAIRQAIQEVFGESKKDESDAKQELLKDIRPAFTEQNPPDRISSAALLTYLNRLEHRQWRDWNNGRGISQRQVSERLRCYGIASHNIRLPGDAVVKGYYLADFEPVFTCYLPQDDEAGRYAATMPENIGDSSLSESATEHSSSGLENVQIINELNACSEVAVAKAETTEVKEVLI